jgi:hypothetical protein
LPEVPGASPLLRTRYGAEKVGVGKSELTPLLNARLSYALLLALKVNGFEQPQ